MTDNFVSLNNITRLDIPVQRILDQAAENIPADGHVMVIGWDNEGDLYFSSSFSDGPEAVWLLEKARLALLTIEVPE